MKCVGKAKLYGMEVEKNRSVGKIYFATKVGEEKGEPIFENDFCNVVFVGKAHVALKEMDKMEELDKKPIYINESQLRMKSGKRKDGSYWAYNEIVVFDFEECENEDKKTSSSSNSRGRRRR